MATSPNYGWSEPDNTSLVKDGALAMRTLGDAIDTSVWNVGYGQAGKNKIINGNFGVNQRNFTTSSTNTDYTFDRWQLVLTAGGGTVTASAQTFTPGTAPVAGYEGTNFFRYVTSGQVNTDARAAVQQKIENVRTFAGQTVTFSFWAKAASGTPNVSVYLAQSFGSGGSAGVTTIGAKQAISTSWARYSWTIAVPSIAGKTIGTTDSLQARIWLSAGSAVTDNDSLGIQNNTFDIWGVQVEAGSIPSPFQTASGGSIQSELAMCQRYYWRNTATGNFTTMGFGFASSATNVMGVIQFPVPMRVQPTSIDFANLQCNESTIGVAVSAVAFSGTENGTQLATLNFTTTLMTTFRPTKILANSTTNAYLGLSAEL